MKNKILLKFILFFISFSFIVPIISYADDPTNVNNQIKEPSVWEQINTEKGKYKFMVPFGPFASVMNDTTDLTSDTVLVDYLRTWFKFLIGIGSIIAVVRLIMVGFKILFESEKIDAKSAYKKELTSIIIAVILVASSWVFLNTINPALVKSNILFPKTTTKMTIPKSTPAKVSTPDKEVKEGIKGEGYYFYLADTKKDIKTAVGPFATLDQCNENMEAFKIELASSTDEKVTDDGCQERLDTTTSQGEDVMRDTFKNSRIFINNLPCTADKKTGCTNVEGLSNGVVEVIKKITTGCCQGQVNCTSANIRNENYCPIYITGGTETATHVSHGPQFPNTFDLGHTGVLNDFLIRNASINAQSFCKMRRYFYNGYWFTEELEAPKNGVCVKVTKHFHACIQDANSKSIACKPVDTTKCKKSTTNPSQDICP